MLFPFDSRNTKKLKPGFYKQRTHFSQIVSKKAKIPILILMKIQKITILF